MTDREHRIDTGSPEERVKAQHPDAVCVGHESEGWLIVTANKTLTSMEKRTRALAWADAAQRLETK